MQDMDMINEELKAKFLAGECTEEELLQIKEWLKNSPQNKEEIFRMEKMSDKLKAQFIPQFGITECLIQYKCSENTPPPYAIRSG